MMGSMVSLIPLPSVNLYLQVLLVITLSLLLSFLRIPALVLTGLHTYVHPDDVNPNGNGALRAAIRRPSAMDSEQPTPRKKSKERFEFDESKAQVFRLTLGEGLLQSRVYFREFHSAFNFTIIAASSILLQKFLSVEGDDGVVKNGTVVPLILGLASVCRFVFLIVKVGFEKSASKKIDKDLSTICGVLGFFLSIGVVFEMVPKRVIDFGLEPLDALGRLLLAAFMGCIVGFLCIPAMRNARCFWLGTDQLRCKLSIISCGWLPRILIYASYVMAVFIALLWITPFSSIFLTENIHGKSVSLVGRCTGISSSSFTSFRNICIAVYGVLQLVLIRSHVQVFLNESVLCWYQRLHASKVPDLEYSRAKVFLHNHYVCLVAIQFLGQAAPVLLLVGLSQLDYAGSYSGLFKEVGVFIAWWIVFVWAAMNSAILVLFRRGSLYIS